MKTLFKYGLIACFIFMTYIVGAQNEINSPTTLKTVIKKFNFFFDKSKKESSSNLDSAIFYAKVANKYAQKSNIDSIILKGLFNLTYYQFAKGDYTNSIQNNNKAIKLATKLNNEPYLLKLYFVSGAINCIQDKKDVGISYFDKALQIAIKTKDSLHIATSYMNIGRAYLGLSDEQNPNAKKFLLKALEVYQSINVDETELIHVYRNLSEAVTEINDRINYIDKAINIAQRENEPYLLADLYLVKGRVFNAEKSYQNANIWFEKSLSISKEINFEANIEATLLALSNTYRKLKEFNKSYYYLKEYNQLFDYKKDNISNQRSYLKTAFQVYAFKNEHKKAYNFAQQYIMLSDSLEALNLNDQFIKYNKAFELEQKNKKIAQQHLEVLEQKTKRNQLIFISITLLLLAIGFYQWYLFKQKKKKQFAEYELKKEKEINSLRANFLENIAHEIRTPITLINGHLTLAKEQLNDKKALIKNINSAITNSNKVHSNANEILELLKLEKGKLPIRKSVIIIIPFFKRIFYSFESLAEIKKIELIFHSNIPINLAINSDKNRIEKILNNLIANAIKFTPNNSKIIFDANIYNNRLSIKVTDFGPGIAIEEQKKIFKRFYQTPNSNNVGGVGVGLSLVKEFAESLKGEISVQSEPDNGATFIFSLPIESFIVEEQTEQIKNKEISIQQDIPINNKENILIIEDNPEMNAYLSEILSNQFNCDTAFNGVEGLQKVQTKRYSLIISDVMMPQMDGFELKQKINNLVNYKNIPFVFITAKAQLSNKIEGYNLGIDDYITKPFAKEELQVRIKNILLNKAERELWVKDNLDFIGNDKNAEEQLLNKIKTIVQNNIANENFKVTHLAEGVAYSSRQLSRLLKKLTGLSPVQFILEIRLQKAYLCLAERKFTTIAEVRNYVGMPSAAHFNKKFTERFGIKPSEV